MTTQYLSDWDELAAARRTRPSTRARRAAAPAVGAAASEAADQGRWLTFAGDEHGPVWLAAAARVAAWTMIA